MIIKVVVAIMLCGSLMLIIFGINRIESLRKLNSELESEKQTIISQNSDYELKIKGLEDFKDKATSEIVAENALEYTKRVNQLCKKEPEYNKDPRISDAQNASKEFDQRSQYSQTEEGKERISCVNFVRDNLVDDAFDNIL